MADPFARMHERLFANLGEGAVLRVADNVRVSVEHGTAVSGEYGEVTGYRTVVDIHYAGVARPKKDDALVVGAATYKLDAALKDDGYTARWIVL